MAVGTHFKDAGSYAKTASIQKEFARSIINNLSVKPDWHLLDVGCGDGELSAELALLVPHGSVTAIDMSESMIKFAEEQYKNIKNLQFKKSDICEYKAPSKFDLIVSFNALHWVVDQKQALININTHLQLGSEVKLLIFPPLKQQPLLYNSIINTANSDKWKNKFIDYHEVAQMSIKSPEEYKQLLEETGYSVKTCCAKQTMYTYDNKDHLVDALSAWLPHAQHLTADEKKEFVRDIVNDILKRIGKHDLPDDASITFPITRWEVEASGMDLAMSNLNLVSQNYLPKYDTPTESIGMVNEEERNGVKCSR
jgi:trans-aconitate methyltransferase